MTRKKAKDAPEVQYFNMGPWPCYFGFTMDPDAFGAEMKRIVPGETVNFTGSPHAHATCHSFVRGDGLTIIITLKKPGRDRTKEQVAALIAHEAMHAVQEIKESYSPNHPLGTESEAYLLQYITQCCLQEAWATGREKAVKP